MKKFLFSILVLSLFSSCETTETAPVGSAVFYTTSSARKMTITISKSTFAIPVTTNPNLYCEMGYTGYIVLSAGKHSYSVVVAGGGTFNGEINVSSGICSKIEL
jgi:hypothetical protein